jgi:hypothetical protein
VALFLSRASRKAPEAARDEMRTQLPLFLRAKKLFCQVGRTNGCLRWLAVLYWQGNRRKGGRLACRFVTRMTTSLTGGVDQSKRGEACLQVCDEDKRTGRCSTFWSSKREEACLQVCEFLVPLSLPPLQPCQKEGKLACRFVTRVNGIWSFR